MSSEGRSGLYSYIIRRALQTIPLVIGVIVFTFLMIRLAPGDPVYYFLGEQAGSVSDAYLQTLRHALGFDQPLYVQLYLYLVGVLTGNLGTSIINGQPVSSLIWDRIGPTLLLMGIQMVGLVVLGIGLGLLAASKRHTITDYLAVSFTLVGYSIPVFWSGLMLLIVFSLDLGWFPSAGMYTAGAGLTGLAYVGDVLRHLVLPVSTLVFWNLAVVTRLTRASMVEALTQDYITTARAKGVPLKIIFRKHALRNSLLPVVTVIGLNVGWMLGGSVLVETVFGWPGLGLLIYDSVLSRNFPVVIGIFIVTSFMIIAANLITDVLYAVIDPRVRYR